MVFFQYRLFLVHHKYILYKIQLYCRWGFYNWSNTMIKVNGLKLENLRKMLHRELGNHGNYQLFLLNELIVKNGKIDILIVLGSVLLSYLWQHVWTNENLIKNTLKRLSKYYEIIEQLLDRKKTHLCRL